MNFDIIYVIFNSTLKLNLKEEKGFEILISRPQNIREIAHDENIKVRQFD